MMYKIPEDQFLRCAFPRGRIISQIEDELTILVDLIIKYSELEKGEFDSKIDTEYTKLKSATPKTIKNLRTEMTTLFGLTSTGIDKRIIATRRTSLLFDTQNFPLFFKTFCNRFQFPNCVNKSQETNAQINAGVRFKPAKFILELFHAGNEQLGNNFTLNASEVSNLVFNNLLVTTGKKTAQAVLVELIELRRNKTRFEGGSKATQHGREFLGYMYLARLLNKNESSSFFLNTLEKESIEYIKTNDNYFEFPTKYETSLEARKEARNSWDEWYGDVTDDEIRILKGKGVVGDIQQVPISGKHLSPEALKLATPTATDLKSIGDKGEFIVLKYEKEKIANIRPDKIHLVQRVANDTSLGYDIQSLNLDDVSIKKYIEVKTTERTFPPSNDILSYFPMSGNEWNTAKNFGDNYYIYRVFLTREESTIFIIKNPVEQEKKSNIILEVIKYRVIIKKNSGIYAN